MSDFIASLDPPLGIPKPNTLAIVSFDLPIAKGDKIHCLDVLHSLTKYTLGFVDDDSEEFAKLTEQMDEKFKKQFPTRKELEIVSSTREWKRLDTAARCIQKFFRLYSAHAHRGGGAGGGAELASLLRIQLEQRDRDMAVVAECHDSGGDQERALARVRDSGHYLLVLTPGTLDPCSAPAAPSSRLHLELAAALRSGAKIIPVTVDFSWPEPESLPQDIRAITSFNGVRWIHDYQVSTNIDIRYAKTNKYLQWRLQKRTF